MPRPRSRKIITRVIVFVLLGAIINVAVAWGCAIFVNVQSGSCGFNNFARGNHRYGFVRYDSAGAVFAYGDSQSGDISLTNNPVAELPSWGDLQEQGSESTQMKSIATNRRGPILAVVGPPDAAIDGRGWPVISLWCHRTVQQVYRRDPNGLNIVCMLDAGANSAIPTGMPHFGFPSDLERVLPLRIAFPGFAINTVFYAGILWLLFAVPGAIRRAARRRRGLCPACAYPISTSDKCTECGAAVIPTQTTGGSR